MHGVGCLSGPQVRPKVMRIVLVLGAVLLASALSVDAAPTDDCDTPAPSEHPEQAPGEPTVEATPVQYRKETLDTLSKNTTEAHVQTKTKSKEKVKVKHLKNGGTVTIIKDTSRTKTKKDSLTDEYSQTNHTLTEGGVEDSTSLTQDHQHEVKEVDVVKKKDVERIVRDKDGNIISDTKKSRVKEKDRKKEKDKQTKKLVHTVKAAPPPVTEVPADTEAPPVATDAPTAPDC